MRYFYWKIWKYSHKVRLRRSEATTDFCSESTLLFLIFDNATSDFHFTDDNGYLPTVMNTNPFLYRLRLTSIVTIHRLWLLSNTTGATSGAGVAYPSGAPELLNSPWFLKGSCYSSFSFQCSVVCFILLAMVLFVFRLNDLCLPLWYLWISFF